jgi:hypothetical protein
MYLRNRENISLTKKKKLQRKQKGGLTIRQRLALLSKLSNSISPSHIFKFRNRNRTNKVVQEPSPPTEKRTGTRTRTGTGTGTGTGTRTGTGTGTGTRTGTGTGTGRNKTTATAIATDAETTDAAEIVRRQAQELRDAEMQSARLRAAANRAFVTESAKLARESQELSDEFNRALFGKDAIVKISPNSNTLRQAKEEDALLAELYADDTLSQEDEALLQDLEELEELEEIKKGGKKSRTHRKPKRARK